jgi:hypothetical protein
LLKQSKIIEKAAADLWAKGWSTSTASILSPWSVRPTTQECKHIVDSLERNFGVDGNLTTDWFPGWIGWTDAASDSPEVLAAKFIERFPELSKACAGKDPAYANWYSQMLQETAPDGLVYAYADYPVAEGYLPVQNKPGLRIQLPPRWR